MSVERRWINLFIVCSILGVQNIAILIIDCCLGLIHHAVIKIYSILARRKSLHHHSFALTFFQEAWLLIFTSRVYVDIFHLLVCTDSVLPLADALLLIFR